MLGVRVAVRLDFWRSNLVLSAGELKHLIYKSAESGDLVTAIKLMLVRNIRLRVFTREQFQGLRVFQASVIGQYPYYLVLNPMRAGRADVAKEPALMWDPDIVRTNPDILDPANLSKRWPDKIFIRVSLSSGRTYYLSHNDYPCFFNSGMFISEHRVPLNNEPWQFEDLLLMAALVEGYYISINDPRIGASRPERLHMQFFAEDQGIFRDEFMPFEEFSLKRHSVLYKVGTVDGVNINRIEHPHPIYKASARNMQALVEIYDWFVKYWINEDKKLIHGIECAVVYNNGVWTAYYFPRSRTQKVPGIKKTFASGDELLGFMTIDMLDALESLERNTQEVLEAIFTAMRLPEDRIAALEEGLIK